VSNTYQRRSQFFIGLAFRFRVGIACQQLQEILDCRCLMAEPTFY
jgi:hypothetical protein